MRASPISVTSAPASGGPLGERAGHARARRGACRGRRRRSSAPVHHDERVAHPTGELLVDLVGDGAADVVGLEGGGQVGRVAWSPCRRPYPGPGRLTSGGPGRVAQSSERSERRWPRRTPSSGRGPAGPAASTGRGWAASRTASARASRSSEDGPARSSRASRSTSQPRGAESRSLCGVAQVVGVRLGVGRERADDGGLVGVDVGERGRRRTTARGARTTTEETHAQDATTRAGPPARRLAVVTTPDRGRSATGAAADARARRSARSTRRTGAGPPDAGASASTRSRWT